MKKLGITLAILLGSLVNLFAGEGVVLYEGWSPNHQYIYIYIDTDEDEVEDTILVLGGSTLHSSIYRRVKPTEENPHPKVTFDDKQIYPESYFDYMWGEALLTINGKPARPQQNTH